jgi:hypothetical protein
MDETKGREARLKPEYSHLYPPLEGGRWESAGILADRMVSWLLRQHRGYVSLDRVLRSEHWRNTRISGSFSYPVTTPTWDHLIFLAPSYRSPLGRKP